ncbi:PD-(D/E)XK nuclease family protein [Streptomyces bobili]|uniref:RecB family exonuclease n=1 Tax=Streptomyces bobili TaxID=67280 RepID=UPI00343923E0
MQSPPSHISHSARETLLRCARSWFLSRMTRAPKRPATWLVGGSAVHETTEFYDLHRISQGDEDPDLMKFELAGVWETCFEKLLFEAREREPNEYKWAQSKAEPVEVWRRIGLEFVQSYIDWRERSPWEIWTTPDGEPAVELDISGRLPGCEVEIKAYLDRVMKDPLFGKLWIIDLKTGKKPPATAAQFETYAALLKVKYGVDVHDGAAFMNRKGGLSKPFDLSEVTPESVGAVYGAAWEQIQGYLRTGLWPADTSDCFLCDVQASCAAVNGPLAPRYDPASPGYTPF